MREIENSLIFTAKASATVYFFAPTEGSIAFKAEQTLAYRFTDSRGVELESGCEKYARLAASGGSCRLTFMSDAGGSTSLTLYCDDGILPYIMPGVGVLWEHGTVFSLLLARGCRHSLWLIDADADTSEAVSVIKGVDYGEDVHINADGEPFSADWYPKMERPWFWHSAELPSVGLIRFDLPESKSDVRFTAYNRTVTALAEPKLSIPFGELMPTVTDSDGNVMDARIEVFVGGERVALCDRLCEDGAPVYLPHGRYRVRASHGAFWSEAEAVADIGEAPACVTLMLEETLKLPSGWMLGELHTHSSLEDATLFPKQVMRAACACGRNFCFMTDKDVGLLERFGLNHANREGRFLGLSGQEIMCHELHTNVLNPSRRINNPEAEDLTAVNHDIKEKISGWLSEYREMKKSRPCLIMHNHPEHRAEVMKRGQPYFRSWWVSDLFSEDYHLVENCGYEGWFDRLNRGMRIYAAWTGDGHDCTLMYPGREGVCVYTGGELSARAIIDALEAGRFFSCREPGAFIDIALTSEHCVTVTARSPLEIDTVEVIADGCVIAAVSGDGRRETDTVCELPENARWCMARVKLRGGEWDASAYSFTPFMAAGYAAFTNPLFIVG